MFLYFRILKIIIIIYYIVNKIYKLYKNKNAISSCPYIYLTIGYWPNGW